MPVREMVPVADLSIMISPLYVPQSEMDETSLLELMVTEGPSHCCAVSLELVCCPISQLKPLDGSQGAESN